MSGHTDLSTDCALHALGHQVINSRIALCLDWISTDVLRRKWNDRELFSSSRVVIWTWQDNSIRLRIHGRCAKTPTQPVMECVEDTAPRFAQNEYLSDLRRSKCPAPQNVKILSLPRQMSTRSGPQCC